ncbi:MAG: FAD-binding protein [Coriobacteriales bacterium]|nr:FAD-binding protein [Coriobacteriales bacterium]
MDEVTGKISRRDFLRGAAAVGGTAAAAMLAGCSPGANNGESPQGTQAGEGQATGSQLACEVYDADVLIIGGGLAGTAAARAAFAKGANVILMDKGPYGFSGGAGYNWSVDTLFFDDADMALRVDAWQYDGVVNQRVAQVIDKTVREEGGIARNTNTGTALLTRNPDGSLWKVPFPQGGMVNGTFPRHDCDLIRKSGVPVLDKTMVTELIIQDGSCCGAVGIHLPTGALRVVRAKATVSCAGGYQWVYGWASVCAKTINSPDNTGDMDAIALRHGCELGSLEYGVYDLIMSYPEGIAYSFNGGIGVDPDGQKHIVCDKDGEYFLRDLELTRAEFIVKIAERINEGKGSPNGGIYVDVRDVDGQMSPSLQTMPYKYARNIESLRTKFGIDARKDLLEMSVENGESVGHPVIDENFQTSILGLFWAPSCNTTFPSTASTYGGTLAARNAVDYARSNSAPVDMEVFQKQVEDELTRLLEVLGAGSDNPIRPHEVMHAIQKAAGDALGQMRSAQGLTACLEELKRIEAEDFPRMCTVSKTGVYNLEWKHALEAYNLLDVARAIASASLAREDSRGTFMREEFPQMDNDNWLCDVGVSLQNGEVTTRKIPLDFSVIPVEEVKKIIELGPQG